jgi:hypothetical protein
MNRLFYAGIDNTGSKIGLIERFMPSGNI